MENCPACNAKYLGRGRCHRCKSDLDILLKIESQAEECMDKAFSAFKKREYDKMYHYAKKSSLLKFSQRGKKLLFYSAILSESDQVPP